jgi:ketosteroid isomerase-like protein
MLASTVSMLLPMLGPHVAPYRRTRADQLEESADMNQFASTVLDDAFALELSERLADVFRTADASDVLADDVFLDGNPPLWRFQLEGRAAFDAWIKSFMAGGADTTVLRTIPTATGFVTEFAGRHQEDGEEMTDRKILLADVRGGRIAELTVYCSGDWNADLRARHAAETRLIRP